MSLYSRARDLDPGFAIARARLALMHVLVRRDVRHVGWPSRAGARGSGDRAPAAPGLAEAREALASYWILKGDAARAIEELRLALDAFPNSADLRVALGGAL